MCMKEIWIIIAFIIFSSHVDSILNGRDFVRFFGKHFVEASRHVDEFQTNCFFGCFYKALKNQNSNLDGF